MNKVEKIKAEIERRLRIIEPNLPSREEFDKVADRNPGINSDFNIGEKMGAYTMLKKIEQFIDSIEQPIKRTPADIEAAMQEVEEKSKLFTEAHKDDVVSNDPISNPLEISRHGNSHIGETLEKAAGNYAFTMSGEDEVLKYYAFIAGAQWQKKRDQSTIELAEDHAYLAGQEKIIAKACEWLENYFKGVSSGTVYLEDFKKAIKE